MRLPKQIVLLILFLMTVGQGWADTGKLYTSGKLSSSLIECICKVVGGMQ